jgi:hypothetical protein
VRAAVPRVPGAEREGHPGDREGRFVRRIHGTIIAPIERKKDLTTTANRSGWS